MARQGDLMKRKLSISQITTRDWTIGAWFDKLDACGLERAIEILQQHQLPVASLVGHPTTYTSRDRSALKAAIAQGLEDIDLALRLGTDCLIITLAMPPHGLQGRTVAEMDQTAVSVLRRLGAAALSRGVTIAIEPLHPMYIDYLNTIDDFMRIVSLAAEVV